MALIEMKRIYKVYHPGEESEVRALNGVSALGGKGGVSGGAGHLGLRKVDHDEHYGMP